MSVTAGIVSKRLNLSENFLDHLVVPSFKNLGPHHSSFLRPLRQYKIPRGTPSAGACTGGVKIGDFRAILDVHRRLSRKWCEIGRWLLWNVNRDKNSRDGVGMETESTGTGWGWGQVCGDGDRNHGNGWGWGRTFVPVQLSIL